MTSAAPCERERQRVLAKASKDVLPQVVLLLPATGLGVTMQPVNTADMAKLDPALACAFKIDKVEPGQLADKLGLKPGVVVGHPVLDAVKLWAKLTGGDPNPAPNVVDVVVHCDNICVVHKKNAAYLRQTLQSGAPRNCLTVDDALDEDVKSIFGRMGRWLPERRALLHRVAADNDVTISRVMFSLEVLASREMLTSFAGFPLHVDPTYSIWYPENTHQPTQGAMRLDSCSFIRVDATGEWFAVVCNEVPWQVLESRRLVAPLCRLDRVSLVDVDDDSAEAVTDLNALLPVGRRYRLHIEPPRSGFPARYQEIGLWRCGRFALYSRDTIFGQTVGSKNVLVTVGEANEDSVWTEVDAVFHEPFRAADVISAVCKYSGQEPSESVLVCETDEVFVGAKPMFGSRLYAMVKKKEG